MDNNRAIRELNSLIEDALKPSGILYRVFGRAKENNSLRKKIEKCPNKYQPSGKKIQDFLGVRVTLYFSDDVDIAVDLLKRKFDFIATDSVIDQPEGDVFSAKRFNLIFKTPESINVAYPNEHEEIIDKTFEVQFRTVLSEGWHEVEHDLRYKTKEDWNNHNDLNRALNGIFATLETSDWGIIKLFEELSYRHYKDNKVEEMLRTKFRLRLNSNISCELLKIITEDSYVFKALFRASRPEIIKNLSFICRYVPLTYDTLVHVINYREIQSEKINELQSEILLVHLENISNI
ncbi:MAG TPA: RelA/SpoT domain-containing protein [Aequorivita sp.]|nr:RelA/SpoT domain-containing protein [Aequorivita sp.]